MPGSIHSYTLKRNRSYSTTWTACSPPSEPVSKLSKLKNSFVIFTHKLARPFTHISNDNDKANSRLVQWVDTQRRPSLASNIFQRFRSEVSLERKTRKGSADHDFAYEQRHYLLKATRSHTKLSLEDSSQVENTERNSQTVPASPQLPRLIVSRQTQPELPGILVQCDSSCTSSTKPCNNSSLLIPPSHPLPSHSRNPSHISSSNITVDSEHLTAKEFADLTGIRIQSDDDDEIPTSNTQLRTSSCSISSACSKPQIWDREFWQSPSKLAQDLASQDNLDHRDEPPVFNQLRRMNTRSSDKLSNHSRNLVIKKGRFEICLEAADDQTVPSNT